MHPNVALLILAGCTPVQINGSQNRSPRRIGALSANGMEVLGRRASRYLDNAWLLGDWAIWELSAPSSAYRPVDWVHPDAQWDQIPQELLIAFTEGR